MDDSIFPFLGGVIVMVEQVSRQRRATSPRLIKNEVPSIVTSTVVPR